MKYLVAEMTEREKIIAKLKGSLYSLSLSELVKKSIDQAEFEVANMDCLHCDNQQTEVRNKLKSYTENVKGEEVRIDVTRYPVNTCPNCNAEYEDSEVSRYLAELIRIEILHCLRTGKKFPERIRFNEIIKM